MTDREVFDAVLKARRSDVAGAADGIMHELRDINNEQHLRVRDLLVEHDTAQRMAQPGSGAVFTIDENRRRYQATKTAVECRLDALEARIAQLEAGKQR